MKTNGRTLRELQNPSWLKTIFESSPFPNPPVIPKSPIIQIKYKQFTIISQPAEKESTKMMDGFDAYQ